MARLGVHLRDLCDEDVEKKGREITRRHLTSLCLSWPLPVPRVQNAELLAGVKEGDIIQSAKVISGMDKFIKGST